MARKINKNLRSPKQDERGMNEVDQYLDAIVDDLAEKIETGLEQVTQQGIALNLLLLCQEYYTQVDEKISLALIQLSFDLLKLSRKNDKNVRESNRRRRKRLDRQFARNGLSVA